MIPTFRTRISTASSGSSSARSPTTCSARSPTSSQFSPERRRGLQTIHGAAAALGEALGERRILMIVDDVWREQDLRPFLQGGRNTTRLITTRLSRVLPANAFRQPVDAMTGDEARELLASGLPKEQVRAQSRALSDLAGRLGEWAQLLKLVNGFLRERVIEGGERLRDALADANERLTEEGLDAFDADDEGDRTKAVARTINLSLGLLDEKQRARFAELAVFPEDADIPIGIVARLWRQSAGLSEGQTKDLLVKLYGLSLLLGLDLNQRTFRFHDTIRRFLQDQAGKEGLVAQHKQLLRALDDVGTSPETDASRDAISTSTCRTTWPRPRSARSSITSSSILAGSRRSSRRQAVLRRWSPIMNSMASASFRPSLAELCG